MKIPFGLVAAVNKYRRHAHMTRALDQGYPRLQPNPIDERAAISIVGYGPSLEETWREIQRPILSMSGATKFLAERGIIADYHLDMDPREHKVSFISPPVPGVHYLMASVCHPKTWKILAGQRITLFHTYSGPETEEWIAEMDPGQGWIHGGSTIGLAAVHVGGVLGYRHFEIHGMDASFKPDRSARHAGPHGGTKQQDGYTWQVGGVVYQTSRIMSNAAAETINMVENFPVFCVFHGQGLTQALIRERDVPNACCVDEVEKAAKVRAMVAHVHTVGQPAFMNPEQTWDRLYGADSEELWATMAKHREIGEALRVKAKYNTGTITLEQMVQLRRLSTKLHPRTVIEIGTFLGNSAYAMLDMTNRVFTCDRDNDCVEAIPGRLMTFPYTHSTAFLKKLSETKEPTGEPIRADLFFVDGRLAMEDLGLVLGLSHSNTLFILDDYRGNEKGVINARLLASVLPKGWKLLEPDPRYAGSTLAALVPRGMVGDGEIATVTP